MSNQIKLAAGYALTVTPAAGAPANVYMVEDPTVSAMIYGARTFGPYLLDTTFVVTGNGTTTSTALAALAVSLATNGGSTITSTAAQVKAAIEAHEPANRLVSVAVHTGDSGTGDDGSGVVTAMASTALTGGAGTGIGVALPGALCINTTDGDVYRNDGTKAAPAWVQLGDAA